MTKLRLFTLAAVLLITAFSAKANTTMEVRLCGMLGQAAASLHTTRNHYPTLHDSITKFDTVLDKKVASGEITQDKADQMKDRNVAIAGVVYSMDADRDPLDVARYATRICLIDPKRFF